MPYQNTIFLNLPVSDLEASLKFYKNLGFVQNMTFSDQNAVMVSLPLIPDSNAHESPVKLMLLKHEFFKGFLPKDRTMSDPKTTSHSIICLSRDSKEGVDELIAKAGEAGGKMNIRGKADIQKTMEQGGMYSGVCSDPDGHIIECVYMPKEMWEGKE